jgi:hypothetical protein
LAYRLSTRKSKILNWKYKIPLLDISSKHKRKRRKLLQETRSPACKMAVNWVIGNIRRMVQKRAHEDGK